MRKSTPAEDAKTDEFKKEEEFMSGLVDGFKDFVLDSMAEGMHREFDDHHDFLKVCFYTWRDIGD